MSNTYVKYIIIRKLYDNAIKSGKPFGLAAFKTVNHLSAARIMFISCMNRDAAGVKS